MAPANLHEPAADAPPYADVASIEPGDLAYALGRCVLFDDSYLRMQATNLGMVDVFLNQLELQLLQALVGEDATPLSTAIEPESLRVAPLAAGDLINGDGRS